MIKVLGLTGSIGMGKSTTAAMFAESGIPVWDADAVVHRLYSPEGPAPAALNSAFPGTIREDGHVNRDALRALIAKDPDVLDQINAIVHPMVAKDRAEFLSHHTGLVVLDVPLLFETGLDPYCDKIAVVSVDAQTQRERVLSRGTMTSSDFDLIMTKQLPDAEKRKRADYIIDTSTPKSAQDMVSKIIEDLT